MEEFDRRAFILNNKTRSTDDLRIEYAQIRYDPDLVDRAFLIMSEVSSRGEGVDVQPEPPVPVNVQMWQAKAVLNRRGLLESVDAVIAQSGVEIQSYWGNATVVERASPVLANLAPVFGLSEKDVDNIFREAAAISL